MSRSLTLGVKFEFVVDTLALDCKDSHFRDTRNAYFPASLIPNYKEILEEQIEDIEESDFLECGPCADVIATPLKKHGIPALSWFRKAMSKYAASKEDLDGWR